MSVDERIQLTDHIRDFQVEFSSRSYPSFDDVYLPGTPPRFRARDYITLKIKTGNGELSIAVPREAAADFHDLVRQHYKDGIFVDLVFRPAKPIENAPAVTVRRNVIRPEKKEVDPNASSTNQPEAEGGSV